jgi:hypothetical protein
VFIGDEGECTHKDHVDSGDVVAFEDFKSSTPKNDSGVNSRRV